MPQFSVFVLVLALAQTPAIDSSSPRERGEAVRSMAVLGNRGAVPALVEAYAKEPSGELRTEIVRAMGRIRDESAIPLLRDALLMDFEQTVRLQAVDSLLRLYIPVADEGGFRAFITDVTRVFTNDPQLYVGPNVNVAPAAKDVLLEALKTDFDWEVRVAAANALGSLRAVDHLPAMIEELEGPRHRENREVQIALIRSMASMGSVDAGPVLTQFIRNADARVAREAIEAVGRAGYREAFPQLSQLFRTSDNRDTRRAALEAITLLGDPRAISLFESLLDSREDVYRELAARGLARLDYDASGLAERFDSERDANVRLAQAFALVASGDSSFLLELISALDSRRAQAAEVYLFELGRFHGKLPELYPHLRNSDADIRARLVGVLGQIGLSEARRYVEPLTRDRDDRVAQAAVDALRNLAP